MTVADRPTHPGPVPSPELVRQWKARVRAAHAERDPETAERPLAPAAADLVGAARVDRADRVLDVAAGAGAVARVAAGLGAAVAACDLVSRPVRFGRDRAARDGLAVGWVQADAEALPFATAAFTVALSNFGVMYAPRPAHALDELVRVVVPGGRLGITAHTPDSLNARLPDLIARYLPEAGAGRAVVLPERWGAPGVVRGWLADRAAQVTEQPGSLVTHYESVEEFWARQSTRLPPLRHLVRSLGAETVARFRDDYCALAAGFAVAGSGFRVAHPYLRVVAVLAEPGR